MEFIPVIDLSRETGDDHSQFYKDLEMNMLKVYSSILLVVGTLGNTMSILVLSRKSMRGSNAAIYLIVLAVSDLLVLYTGILRYWVLAFFQLDLRHLSDASCKINKWMVYVTLDVSVWTVVALTFERLTSVYLPYHVKNMCTMRRSVITIGLIVVVMLAFNSQLLYTFGRTYRQEDGFVDNKCTPLPGYEFFENRVWPWIDMCVYSIMPCLAVVVCNTAIVVKVHSEQRHIHPHPHLVTVAISEISRSQDTRKLSSMTAMLVSLNTVMILTTMPVSVFLIAQPYVISEGDSLVDKAKVELFGRAVLLLMYTFHAIIFFLFCISGSRFREELRAWFNRKSKVSQSRTDDTTKKSSPRGCRKYKGMLVPNTVATTEISSTLSYPLGNALQRS